MTYTNIKLPAAKISKKDVLKPFEQFKAVYNQEISKQKSLLANKDMYSPTYLQQELETIRKNIITSYTEAADKAMEVYESSINEAKKSLVSESDSKTLSTEEQILRQMTMLNTRHELQDQFEMAADPESFASVINEYQDNKFAMKLITRELDKRSSKSDDTKLQLQYQSIARELQGVEVPGEVIGLIDGIKTEKAFKSYKLPTESGEFEQLEIEYRGVRED